MVLRAFSTHKCLLRGGDEKEEVEWCNNKSIWWGIFGHVGEDAFSLLNDFGGEKKHLYEEID